MQKSHFADALNVRTIDLGDGDWVKVPAVISFGTIEKFATSTGTDVEQSICLLEAVVKEWNFIDSQGQPVAISQDSLRMLDVQMVNRIVKELEPMLSPEKKSLSVSEPQS